MQRYNKNKIHFRLIKLLPDFMNI